ncbi:DUF1877 family protein [Streptomyces sp. NPDC051001]
MIGEYLSVTTTELDRVIQTPHWASDFVEGVQDTEEESEAASADARQFST